VDPRAGLNGCGKSPFTGIRPLDRPARSHIYFNTIKFLLLLMKYADKKWKKKKRDLIEVF
jgi:hypothetical protein